MKKTTVKRPYQAPKVTVLGEFRTATGMYGRRGYDRTLQTKA
ncbi:putative RiPP precursor [Actinoplanes regularis]|uniref:Lasso RiPP family leader peptide-containing protein n=1 Tax=Actinoplanes regularis TaxID=52697 RepID=A0A239BPK2_9ACTN|nr:putative RiPP precursor [Actinoplanes regularis]GIE88419.1 hypothetical protein Are01nite_48990 [Actinoplanes regularis]SNS08993.1 hypothetical protein SAMN06264365_1102 [Actinoplanes regularis]